VQTFPSKGQLHEAFLWAESRTVTKTATVSLHSNTYEVNAALVGRKVELIFDPFDLADIEVRHDSQSFGRARPHVVGRHVHPQVVKHVTTDIQPTGIDYLGLVAAQQDNQRRQDTGGPTPFRDLQQQQQVNFAEVHDGEQIPGQLTFVGGDAR
jgi:putative transposase